MLILYSWVQLCHMNLKWHIFKSLPTPSAFCLLFMILILLCCNFSKTFSWILIQKISSILSRVLPHHIIIWIIRKCSSSTSSSFTFSGKETNCYLQPMQELSIWRGKINLEHHEIKDESYSTHLSGCPELMWLLLQTVSWIIMADYVPILCIHLSDFISI